MRKRTFPLRGFILLLLCIEFWDEFVYGVREAAWPLIRDDLGLTYIQIGVLLGLPAIVSSVVEPVLGILGDVWKRRVLILGGGAFFALSLLLTGISQGMTLLLLSFILFYPASGAFVSLSQASLMDTAPGRREQNMARWTLAGSLGVVSGPLALSAAMALSLGWRGVYLVSAMLTVVLLIPAWRAFYSNGVESASDSEEASPDFFAGIREALRALRRWAVLRWLILLSFSDLMLDVLLGYLALYMVDVARVSSAQAATAVAVWTGVGLLGDFLLIPFLERVPGLRYLRVSAGLELALFAGFLIIPAFGWKLLFLALLGFFNAGWYSILKARLYATMPGRSGIVMAVDNLFGIVNSLIPLGLGLVAQHAGLSVAMPLLAAGPVALLIGLPRRDTKEE
ncbi:MAG: MFS transporter [Anaerolineae bacterium]|nr:MFS transporter [Anaerolineae bacterium]